MKGSDRDGLAAMADAYPYALLVELDDNSVPRVKNKLTKYFQSKKSHGGDCEVDYENGSNTAVLRFRKQEDQQNVLAKEDHQINLDKGVLKLTVRLRTDEIKKQEAPSDKQQQKSDAAEHNKQPRTEEPKPAAKVQPVVKKVEDEEDEEPCSTLALIEHIPESVSKELLEMLVENVLKDGGSESFTVEVISTISSAVVTFQTGKDCHDFVASCPSNRNFTKKGLTARPLEVTKQALVDDVKNINQDYLRLYFENAGGEVENFELNELEQSAIITFKDHKAVQKILKKNHQIQKKEIRVYPYYKSLGIALYGEDTPSLKLPASISEPIEESIWRYLKEKQTAIDLLQQQLTKHFCKVGLGKSAVDLSPVPSLLQENDAKAMVKDWRDTVRSAFAQALSQFKSLQLQAETTAWKESEMKIREILMKEDVVVVPDKTSGVISVVGLVSDINRLQQPVTEAINKIIKRMHREKFSETLNITVCPSTYHILCQDGLRDKLQSIYPELTMSFSKEKQSLSITGLKDEILAASKVIYDAMLGLKRQPLEVDDFVLELLKHENSEKLTDALLISNGINAALDIISDSIQLVAVSGKDLTNAGDHLRKLLMSQYIDVEDNNVLKKPEWTKLINDLEKTYSKALRRIQIRVTGEKVVVSGHADAVESVSNDLQYFLTQNAQVEETVSVKPSIKVEYIKKRDLSWLEQMGDKVDIRFNNEAISLSGCRVHVTECQTLVEEFVSSLVFEHFKVPKPGVRAFFRDKEDMYVSSLWTETGCRVQLVNEAADGLDDDHQFPAPVYQIQTPEGIEIAVCKADMCTYPVDAVVNASNPSLKLSGGLSEALLNAAGPQLQAECDQLISAYGHLKTGDSVITNAGGQLSCKNIIHAVGPIFNSAIASKCQAQLRRAVKESLACADQHGCVSVALPAISKNTGFPLDMCAASIVKAVKEYCDERFDDTILKRIHLVNNDDSSVQAMVSAVKQEFGSSTVTSTQQPLQIKPPAAAKPSVSNPNCLGEVKTKEGLAITLLKGNIEDATTQVIVNTATKDLDLGKGAVSQAILRMAGPKLQEEIKAKGANGKVGDVIVTEGCKLRCSHVFHAIAPHWDKGQGTPDEILKGIFRDCLDKAENTGLASISLTAIGTGNLGFPKDLVASLMLKEILKFSSKKQAKYLKAVDIVLYPGDAQTIQVFCDEFKKQFPSASGGAVPTSSTQRSGPFSQIVSGSGLHETKMGNVAVQVVTGDITKENSEVIVNSSNDDFSLRTGVSKAILEAAGQAVEAECQTLGAAPNQGMILTQPGNLGCKKILHVVGRTDPAQVKMVVRDALLLCAKNKFTSVSFPAIGTGQGNVKAKDVADAMFDAVIDVFSQNTSTTLNTIRIVIFQPPMLKDFFSSMQERGTQTGATEPPGDKGWSWGNIGSKLKSLFITPAPKQKKGGDFVIEAVDLEPASFNICSDRQAKVDSAKNWINDLIIKEHNSISIQDNSILNLSDAAHQQIVDIQKNMSVSIRIESKSGQATVTIEGLSKNVLKASHVIHEMLRKTRDEEDLRKKVEMASTVADWKYQLPGLQFQSFDPMMNFTLEQAFEKKSQSVKIKVQGQNYTVTLPSGPAVSTQGQTMEIRRIDKLKDEDIPDSWDPIPADKTCLAVTIQPGTAEHNNVVALFQATCKMTISKIERIQNVGLWKSLQIKKHDMERRNGHQNNEKCLFHGTTEDTVPTINERGFNRSYAGKNAACYGNGTYFAVNASYSASHTYSRPNQNGDKFMYLCRVLTGDFVAGQQNMIEPPLKGTNSVDKYDSVVDNTAFSREPMQSFTAPPAGHSISVQSRFELTLPGLKKSS